MLSPSRKDPKKGNYSDEDNSQPPANTEVGDGKSCGGEDLVGANHDHSLESKDEKDCRHSCEHDSTDVNVTIRTLLYFVEALLRI